MNLSESELIELFQLALRVSGGDRDALFAARASLQVAWDWVHTRGVDLVLLPVWPGDVKAWRSVVMDLLRKEGPPVGAFTVDSFWGPQLEFFWNHPEQAQTPLILPGMDSHWVLRTWWGLHREIWDGTQVVGDLMNLLLWNRHRLRDWDGLSNPPSTLHRWLMVRGEVRRVCGL